MKNEEEKNETIVTEFDNLDDEQLKNILGGINISCETKVLGIDSAGTSVYTVD